MYRITYVVKHAIEFQLLGGVTIPEDKPFTCEEDECFKFDEKVFGVRRPSKATLDNWMKQGWLSKDGICRFPRKVQAHPTGIETDFPIEYFKTATEDDIYKALKEGWIRFADGNGDYYTLDTYKKLYSDFPDPELLLRIEGRFPPDPSKYHVITKADGKMIFNPRM